MKKHIQIRNVPETLHRTLKARAAVAGMSLSEYLLQAVQQMAEQPTVEELRQRLRQRRPVQGVLDAAAIIRAARGPLPHDGD
jgi:hypothetical protein